MSKLDKVFLASVIVGIILFLTTFIMWLFGMIYEIQNTTYIEVFKLLFGIGVSFIFIPIIYAVCKILIIEFKS
jgi:hypothetical protein